MTELTERVAAARSFAVRPRNSLGQLLPIPIEDRFYTKVDFGPAGGCWAWTAARDGYGYGKIFHEGKLKYAHRVSFELAGGVIPSGLVIDHLCRNPSCVNPAHLEPVTTGENTRRGDIVNSLKARAAQRTHCKHGHEVNSETTRLDVDGKRQCRVCAKIRARAARANKSQARKEALGE